jgi:hypothetical protein
MVKFDADAFKMELIKLDRKLLDGYAKAYSYGYTDVLGVAYKRFDQFCKLYHFEKNIIDCDWFYKIDFLTGSGVPKQAALYQYIISFDTPEDGQRPFILLNSLIYGVYDVCNMLYDRFGMVPGNYENWLEAYINGVIFGERNLSKLDNLLNDPHVLTSDNTYRTLLSRAVTEEWVEATALMLRFMKDNDIYEEQETLRL